MRAPIYAAAIAALSLSGCISTVDVRHIQRGDTTTRGLRYSLPATFLLVQPQPDGTANYSWVYLPDPDQTFVINKRSFLAKFTLDVATSNGLLTSVEGQGDTSGVTAKLFDAAQSVYAARVGASSKADTAAATANSSAKAAVASAKLAYDQAVAEQTIIDGDPDATPADKRAIRVKVSNALLALQLAQQSPALNMAAGDVAGGGGGSAGPFNQYGPVLFRVVQDQGQITLVAMNDQQPFETVVAAAAGGGGGATPTNTLTLASNQKLKAGRNVSVKMTLATPIDNVDQQHSTLTKDSLPVTTTVTMTLSPDKKTITAVFAGPLSAGDYSFTPALISSPGASPSGQASVSFTVK